MTKRITHHQAWAIFALVLCLLVFLPHPQSFAASGQTITLKQAQRMALENNPEIKNVAEMIVQADLWINKAWAILLPNISAEGSITRADKEISMQFPDLSDPTAMQTVLAGGDLPMTETVIQELWGKSVGITANMALFNARSIPLLQNAYDNVDRANDEGTHARNNLLFAVAATYYQVYSAEQLIAVSQDGLANSEEFLKLAEARKDVGQGTKIDVLRAETEVMNAQKLMKNAEDARKLAKTALAYLAGIKGEYGIQEPEKNKPVEGDLAKLTDKALDDRLDLKAAELNLSLAERYRIETMTKWVPTFDVTFNYSWNSAEGFGGDKDSWRLIFGAKWPLLEGGMKFAELKERDSQIRVASNSLKQKNIDICEEVETAMLELNKRRRNLELAKQQVALAEETHRLVKRSYEMGLATSLDLTTASNSLNQVRSSMVVEELSVELAVLSLNKASGEYSTLSKTN